MTRFQKTIQANSGETSKREQGAGELLSQHNWQTTELELAGRGGRGRKRERGGGANEIPGM